jgi:hypothetical protein
VYPKLLLKHRYITTRMVDYCGGSLLRLVWCENAASRLSVLGAYVYLAQDVSGRNGIMHSDDRH